MSVLKRNVFANALGQSIGVLSGLMLVPLYNRYLGKDGFGLVGFFISVQALAAILDLGLGASVNRELSRLSREQVAAGDGRDIVRTLEIIYAGVALLLSASLMSASNWLAHNWIKADLLDAAIVRDCVIISVVAISLRLVGALYYGVMRGLERQVKMNVFYSIMALLQTLGIALALVLLRPSIRNFFLLQLCFVAVEIAALQRLVWRELQLVSATRPRFRLSVIRQIWRYALSVNGITIFAAGIKQIDKIVVSKLMSIGNLGYYSAASLAANGIGKIAVPFQTALFPRFSKLFSQQEEDALVALFRKSVRLMSLLGCAVAAGMAFFAYDILYVWMQSRDVAEATATALSILAVAMMFNVTMAPVFSMILATGHTGISLAMNGAGFVVLIPMTYILVDRFGLAGAAMAWLAFNLAYYLIVPVALSRRWPIMSVRRFYLKDTAPFLLLSVCVFAVGSHLSEHLGSYLRLAAGAVCGIVCLALGAALFSDLRRMVLRAAGLSRT